MHGHGSAIGAIVLGLCATLWWAHSKAEDRLPELLGETVVVNSTLACISLEEADRMADLTFIQKDKDAAIQFFLIRKPVGLCMDIEKGTTVYVERVGGYFTTPVLGHWICVRPVGNPNCYWAPSIMINDKERQRMNLLIAQFEAVHPGEAFRPQY